MSLNRRSNHLLRDIVMQLRTLLVLALITAYVLPYLGQGYDFRSRFAIAFNAWGAFACAMSNARILLVCFAGYVLLLSDLPCFSSVNTYEVIRSSRRSLMPVRVLAILKLTVLYIAILFVLFSILGGCTDFDFNRWDKIHYSYAHGQIIDDLYMDVPAAVILNYTPLTAFMMSVTLLCLVFSSMGMLLLFGTMLFPAKKAVFTGVCVLAGLDMAIDDMGFGYRMYLYSPLSYARLSIIEAHDTNAYYPSKEQIVLVALLIFIAMAAGCVLFPVRRRLGYLNVK